MKVFIECTLTDYEGGYYYSVYDIFTETGDRLSSYVGCGPYLHYPLDAPTGRSYGAPATGPDIRKRVRRENR